MLFFASDPEINPQSINVMSTASFIPGTWYTTQKLSMYRGLDISNTEYGGTATANSAPTLRVTIVEYRIEGFDIQKYRIFDISKCRYI